MRLFFLLFLLFLTPEGQNPKQKQTQPKRVKIDRRQANCAGRLSSANSTIPIAISGSICCNSDIEGALQSATVGDNDESLGDVARKIQKEIQRQFRHSFEIIISHDDFAASSYYGGQRMCKSSHNGYHLLAYETPVSYHLNTKREAFFAALDAQETLGSTPETSRGHFQDYRMDHLAGEATASIQPKPKIARARFFNSKPGENTFLRQGPGLEDNSLLPSNTHCDRGNRGGNKCCSGAIHEVMEAVLGEAATSPDFDDGKKAPGVVANMIKRRIQQRFGRVFEIIVSRGGFAHASHEIGDYICKVESHGMHLMAYETPDQFRYFPFDLAAEKKFSSLSDKEPLGTQDLTLPGQRPATEDLQLETGGERAGFPKGSHCDEGERLGSRCCNLELFQTMYSTVKEMKGDDTFNTFDRRTIATKIRDSAEDGLDSAHNVIVSGDDFVVSSHVDQDSFCKFRVDHYYIAAWETPENFMKGVDQYADNGFTSFIGCGQNIQSIEGVACCNGYLRYVMTRAIDETTKGNYRWTNTDSVARAVANATQETFHTRFNTVVGRGDFIWRSAGNYIDNLVCKIDLFEFHALVFGIGGNATRGEFQNTSVVEIFDWIGEGGSEIGFLQPGGGNFLGPGGVNFPGGENVPLQGIQIPGQPPIIQQVMPPVSFVPQIIQPPVPNVPNIPNIPNQLIVNQPPPQQFFLQPPPQQFIIQQPPPGPPLQQIYYNPPTNFYNYYSPPAYGFNYFAGYCFTEDMVVLTSDGEKRMDELEVGDFVMTANATDAYFAPVTSWMHKEPDTVSLFLEIRTEEGKILRVTDKHLMYRAKCNGTVETVTALPEIGEEVFAEELLLGDCLYVMNQDKWVLDRIQNISTIVRKGIYAPLTTNGRILVNNILASCYSEVKGKPVFQNTFFMISKFIRNMFGWMETLKITPPASTPLWREIMILAFPGSLL